MSMTVRCMQVGPLAANCYLVSCDNTRRGFILDPGGDAPVILEAIREAGVEVDCIINTHCHPDHSAANCPVREGTGARVLIHPADRGPVEQPPLEWLLVGMRPDPCPVDGVLEEKDVLEVGDLRVTILHMPGHSPGGIALCVGNAVFTGDTLFAGGIGRTDLPGGDHATLMASLERLVTELPPETVVYPGHGPASTIEGERNSNDWLQFV